MRLLFHFPAQLKIIFALILIALSRSLLAVPPQDLNHITEVADFACHSVSRDFAHLQQSSWDACLVATAALTLSIASTLVEVPQSPPAPQPLAQTAPQPSVKPWPLCLLSDEPVFHEDAVEDSLSLPVSLLKSILTLGSQQSLYTKALFLFIYLFSP